jgi:hypothetical protein
LLPKSVAFRLVYRPAFDDTDVPGIGFTYQSQRLAISARYDSLARERRVIARSREDAIALIRRMKSGYGG